MSILCKLFGHKRGLYDSLVVDVINTTRFYRTVELIDYCDRCGARFAIGEAHVPLPQADYWKEPEGEPDYVDVNETPDVEDNAACDEPTLVKMSDVQASEWQLVSSGLPLMSGWYQVKYMGKRYEYYRWRYLSSGRWWYVGDGDQPCTSATPPVRVTRGVTLLSDDHLSEDPQHHAWRGLL